MLKNKYSLLLLPNTDRLQQVEDYVGLFEQHNNVHVKKKCSLVSMLNPHSQLQHWIKLHVNKSDVKLRVLHLHYSLVWSILANSSLDEIMILNYQFREELKRLVEQLYSFFWLRICFGLRRVWRYQSGNQNP